MKKSFYRCSIKFIIPVILLTIMFISSILLVCFFDDCKWWHYAIFVIAVVLWFWYIMENFSYKIVLYDDHIYVNNDRIFEVFRTQYSTTIQYNEIKAISIKYERNDSNLKPLVGRNAIRKYLVFALKNNETKRIFIEYYSGKQILSIVQIISERSGINLSDKLMRDINILGK